MPSRASLSCARCHDRATMAVEKLAPTLMTLSGLSNSRPPGNLEGIDLSIQDRGDNHVHVVMSGQTLERRNARPYQIPVRCVLSDTLSRASAWVIWVYSPVERGRTPRPG